MKKQPTVPPGPVTNTAFAEEVCQGLSLEKRKLSSKWFYDERGDALFQKIMAAPEYYLTEAELEIFRDSAADFLSALNGRPFDLVELGAGDGTKTQHLLAHFLEQNADFRYLPIDISRNALQGLEKRLKKNWPTLPLLTIEGEYFAGLDRLPEDGEMKRTRMLLFPGANIGNFTPPAALDFLRALHAKLHPGDLLVIGFDLKKNPADILAAYNDAGGATAAFNLNLLSRINRELGGNFQLEQWKHWPTYDPVSGATRSFLVSQCEQSVHLSALDETYHFAAWEPIDLEISQKYSLKEIESLARAAGYRVTEHLTDNKAQFVDSIWSI